MADATRPTDAPSPRPAGPTRATALLIALRVGYAYNWFDIGPGLPAIGRSFSVDPAAWGALLAAFLVGAGLFQVPAGFLARRFGSRSVALWGAGILGGAAVASGLAPSFGFLLAARVAAGVGAGLFFSPALSLVASLYPSGARGVPVGGFSSAFSGGAALGILGGALLVPSVGWPESLALGGLGLLAVVGLAISLIPRRLGRPIPTEDGARLPEVLRFRGTWAVGLAFIGIEGASFATGQFVVPYGEEALGWAAVTAGIVGMVFVVPSVVGGPVGGWLAERYLHHRTLLVLATVAAAAVLVALPWVGPVGAAGIGLVFSFGYGFVFAVMYVLPHFWKNVPPSEVPIAIGLFNAIQLSGGAAVSALFGYVVAVRSYPSAWEVLALATVASLLALVALPPTRAATPGPRGAASDAPPVAPVP